MAKRKRIATLDEIIRRSAVNATEIARRVCLDIRGDIARLSRDLEIHRKAGDRAKVEKAIKSKIRRMESELSDAMAVALGKAQRDANGTSGLDVRYSPAYAQEIISMVQEQQGENLASVFSRKMSQSIIENLRKATVSTMQEAALTGLSLREQKNLLREKWEDSCKGLGKAVFTDSAGNEWDARDYFTMNVRTNAMRVYNDVLAANETRDGNDLVQVSRHGDPHCRQCFPWEGRILSITGNTKGYPTYEECRAAGCFHPNCTHVLQTVNEIADEDELALQKGLPAPDKGEDPMKVSFENDVEMKVRDGMDRDEAVLAVKRDRIRMSLQVGITDTDSRSIADGLTADEVNQLTNGWNIPVFNRAKKSESAGWNEGSRGGRIVLPRGDVTLEALEEILKRRRGK